ncbi:nuclear transport factor 2 family protein [Sphingopyxis sp. SE2]|jgi:ketosteroid isomerase-like protein|uniref:nuclear transport factor 2 family protein n=1 Tax=unclassified Sphingopyxis TaxID=2614943 RepID=UPI0014468A43|nr:MULTISPECIES: nuclear transport factor 2 family protein [unclassified Sphingopyxis]MDT7529595.1 nuclear transport factor 2 family protein [Sphingopyxis sp. SE2]
MAKSPTEVAKAAFQAYVDDDRAAIEALIADDLVFTSPYDNGIGRETYFTLCWPNHERMAGVDIVRAIESGNEALLTYVGRMKDGRASRNTEIFTIRDGRIHAVEVYFGWSIPHDAAPGQHKNP